MIDDLQQGAQKLKDSEPGHRFQARYHRLQAERDGRFSWKTILNLVVGIGLIAAGVVFWFIPGPGWGFILLGLGFLGSESLAIARTLDRLEVRVRHVAVPLAQWWSEASVLLKAAVGLLLLAGTAAFGYGLLAITVIH
jgi:hypothetical protein